MRKISVDSIKGKEVLAKEILTGLNLILMREGTILKVEYKEKLKELGIDYIYVEDEFSKDINIENEVLIKIKNQCQNAVQITLEKYAYFGNAQLEKLKEIAEEIIYDILEEPKIMFSMYSIRKKSQAEYDHSINVCTLSVIIALKMKISKLKVREIAIGGLLHDIGYNYVTADYKDKMTVDLTKEEISDVKKHVIYGYSAIEKEEWLSQVSKDIILYHHEKLDGSGYPFKLKGDKIKIGSRIVAVADKFDRMIYGAGVSVYKVHEAIEYIMSKSGIWYDIEVVKIFMDSVAAYPTGIFVITNEGEKGIIIKQNNGFPTRPVVRIIKDKDDNNIDGIVVKDLTKHLTIFIRDTMETL